MPGLFVTGTDTGAGKTVVTAAVVAALRAAGDRVRVLKPVITGLDQPSDTRWPHDHQILARAGDLDAHEVAILRYGPPVSPHLAAELSGQTLDPSALVDEIRARSREDEILIVEGAGGLLVPLWGSYDMRALALDLELRLVIAARPGLGTINHTLLTLEAARRAGLDVAGVVMTPWSPSPSVMEESNRSTVSGLGGIEVSVLEPIDRPEPDLLAAAGARLPLADWLPVPVAR